MSTFLEEEAAYLNRLAGIIEGEDRSARRKRECTESMIAACAAGHRHVVFLLVQGGADLNGHDRQNQTALMRAVGRVDIKLAKLLLRLGCDVNTRGINGDTALNISIRRGDEELFRLLLNAGADVFLKKWDGTDAWEIAKSWKRPKFIEILNEVAARGSPLWPQPGGGRRLSHSVEGSDRHLSKEKPAPADGGRSGR